MHQDILQKLGDYMSNKQHVIVISYDAFSKDNWDYASKQPNLAKLIAKGASTTNVKTVYPSLTYVIHTSYVTGMYPNVHKVFHNNPFQPFVPEKDQTWHWYRSDIHARTIYEAAHEAGLKTAGLLWPVSGKTRAIHYNIPEVRAILNESQAWKVLTSGSPLYSMRMELKYGKIRRGIEQPYLDDFTTTCAVDTINRKTPNLFFMHLIDLDDTKHLLGTKGPHIEEVIERMDHRIGEIMKAVENKGLMNQTTFIVVGDHSQLDVRYKINVNALFREHGLIEDKSENHRWRAYVQSAGGAAYLHVQENDREAYEKALSILRDYAANEDSGIEAIFTRDDLNHFHVEDRFDIMLEAKEGYAFEDNPFAPLIVDLHAKGKVYATHGYSPEKPNYTSNLIVAGPGIKQGFTFDQASVIDLAPTLAKILNIPFGPCDGRVLDEIFK